MIDHALDTFRDYFERDLEKRFSADITCCDKCHDEFLSIWPLAATADNEAFDGYAIDLDTLYTGSYLRDEFTHEEFDNYVCQLDCPRCGKKLGWKIWPYNFPFNVPDSFEFTVNEIDALAQTTPFLLLENRFCREVLEEIRELATQIPTSSFSPALFRARSTKSGPVDKQLSNFDIPHHKYVYEGRYNHAGGPVLYLASDTVTCQAELRDSPCVVVELHLKCSLRILDLTDAFNKHEMHADLLNCLVYSALISAKQEDDGMHKPHYVVSRFVADCAKSAGFDAIKYPSTQRTGNNFNLVLVNSGITLEANASVLAYHDMIGD